MDSETKELEQVLPVDYPLEGQIAEWKNKYKNVYKLQYTAERVYIYRGITRTEHKLIKNKIDPDAEQIDQDWLDDEVVKLAILYPAMNEEGVQNLMSGEVPVLAEEIMKISGYIPESAPEKL